MVVGEFVDEVEMKEQEPRCDGYEEKEMEKVLAEFSDVMLEEPGSTSLYKMLIDVRNTKPIYQRPYRVPDKLKDGVRQEIEKLVEAGIVVESCSPCASPIVPVLKSSGAVRLCVGF